jgi:Outer membrane protein beta-barrel domain
MKKVLSLLLLLSIFSSATFAQHRKKFGINTGLNYSKFRGMDLPHTSYDFATGVVVGFSYEYYLKTNLSIKANLLYANKKSKGNFDFDLRENIDDPVVIYNESFTYSYNYMTLPVMIKYDFKNAPGFFVNGGLFLGYLLDSEVKAHANTNQLPELTDFTQSTTELNNQFDFGLAMGFGKSFQINPKNSVVVEIRNNLGLSQTNKNNTFDGNTVRSNSYELLVGWSIDL